MKNRLRGASALALAFTASGLSAAFAQTPQTVPTTSQETQSAPQAEIVTITGTLIATTPEDAPRPVEVITAQDLEEQGSPTASDFIRSLSVSYGNDLGFGQSNADNPQGSGFSSPNLRGVGSSGTLTLVNGRRTVATNGGFGADLNAIPIEAMGSVEILKDGASATYGAGAVGGVINFRTRRDIDAPQITVERTMYDGSDGGYKVDFLTGWVGDTGNFLLTLSHSHEAPMLSSERSFSSLPFQTNPSSSAWALTPGNPGRFHTSTAFLTATPLAPPTFSTPINDYRTASDCTAVGGVIISQTQLGSSNTGCGFPVAGFQDLVSEFTNNRVYAEVNLDLLDSMEFHADISYTKNESFQQRVPVSAPTNRSTDASIAQAACTTAVGACGYVIPYNVGTYTLAGAATGTTVRNPFIDDFSARTGAALAAGGALYTTNHWRPFLFGGTPLYENGLRRERFHREQAIINAGFKGRFTQGGMLGGVFGFLDGVNYDYSAQISIYEQENIQPDLSVARLQNALLGYGGPGCNAVDRVATDYTSAASFNRTVGTQSDTAPGTNGCQWFNPFASGWATSITTHAANPQWNSGAPVLGAGATPRPSGYANPYDLVDWMTVNRAAEDHYLASTYEATFTGQIPWFELPGGEIGWAAGSQWRLLERRSTTYDPNPADEALNTQECPYPDPAVVNTPAQSNQDVGQRGCLTRSGAFFGSGIVNISLREPMAQSDSQLLAFYGELQLPVLSNLNFSLSARREDFNGGDLTADIWSVAGKYDITDNLYVRASYGTNYRAEAALDIDPGVRTFAPSTQTRFGAGFTVQTETLVASDIGPEDDTTFNAGVGWQSRVGEGRIRAAVDFWEITINGEVATTSVTTILSNVFGVNTAAGQTNRGIAGIPNTATANSPGQFADCTARLISFVQFVTPCVQGVTTAANILQVDLQQLNGPGFITNGVDYTFDFSHPLWGGNAAIALTATQNLVYKAGGYSVNGILFDAGGDRLGYNNLTRTGSVSTDWRGNAVLRWANDMHSFNLRANYVGGTYTEAYDVGLLTPYNTTTPAAPLYSTYGVFPEAQLTYDFTYIFTSPWWEELQFRASVINFTDEDPMPAQTASGYFPGIGDPRGRTLELSVTKTF